MSYPVISYDQIQVGDVIRTHNEDIVREGTVGSLEAGACAYTPKDQDLWTESAEKIELVSRPFPTVPTTPGSVVRISHTVTAVAHTLLLGSNWEWTDADGCPWDMEDIKKRGDWLAQVILDTAAKETAQ